MSLCRVVATVACAAGLALAIAAWREPANVLGLIAGMTFCG